MTNIFFAESKELLGDNGSFSKTSIPAPAMISLLRAEARSDSFIIPPLATLIILAVFFIFESLSVLNKFLVESFNGTCKVIISAFLVNSSISTILTLSSLYNSLFTYGSNPKIFILKDRALLITSLPILPRPTTPSTLFFNSFPTKLALSQRP